MAQQIFTAFTNPANSDLLLYTIAQGSISAGNEPSVQLPSNNWWRLIAFTSFLGTSVTVASRFPALFVQDANSVDIGMKLASPNPVTAGQTIEVFSGPDAPVSASTSAISFPFYRLQLPPGALLGLQSFGLQAGDQWANFGSAFFSFVPIKGLVAVR